MLLPVSSSFTAPKLLGAQRPRIGTHRDPAYASHGPLMVAVAEVAGLELDEWQSYVGDVALEHEPDGKWRHRTITYVVARQNGKTFVFEARTLLGLYALPEKLILHTAQDRTLPRELFESLVTRIGDTPALHKRLAGRGKGIRETNGQERIKLKDGSTYRILAPREKAFRGPSADLILFDEIREQRDTSLWGAAFPTQRVRPNPQIWATSNAGGPEAVQLGVLQERGRTAADFPGTDTAMCYLEWSAHPSRKVDDRAGWAEANPALGTRLTEEAIEEELRSLDADKFETEILCRSITARTLPAIPWPAWEACGGEPGIIEDGAPRPVMGIHINGDRTHAALAMVALRHDRLVSDICQEWIDPEGVDLLEITADVLAWMRHYRVRTLGYDRVAASVIAQRAAQKRYTVEKIDPTEYVVASQNLFDAVATGVLYHPNNASLNEQIAAAGRKVRPDGSWWINQAASTVQIPAVIALAFAVNLAYRPTIKAGVG